LLAKEPHYAFADPVPVGYMADDQDPPKIPETTP
jgi:hypothetical protein